MVFFSSDYEFDLSRILRALQPKPLKGDSPLITIVTPSFNRAGMIGRSIESVCNSQNLDVEHIVVDGGSSDGTLELLNQYPHLRVISEPDRGIYDAMNKGIALARGELIGFLNADDWFEPGWLSDVADAFAANPDVEVISGGARLVVQSNGKHLVPVSVDDRPDQIALSFKSVAFSPNVNAHFFRSTLFARVGRFAPKDYPLSADRDFLFRVVLTGVREVSVDRVLYTYLSHSGSKTLHGSWRQGRSCHYENVTMAERYLAHPKISNADRKVLKRWHAECAARGAASDLLLADPAKGLNMAIRGLKLSPSMPLAAMRVAARAIRRKARRVLG